MESQQVGQYITEQLRAGHTEAALRQHMVQHGWSQAAVDQAFTQHFRTDVSDIKPVKRGHRKHPRHSWKAPRRMRLAVAGVVIIAAAAVGYTTVFRMNEQALPVAAEPLSYQAKQAIDVATIGGAVVQYASATETLPTLASVQPSGNLLLCSALCDPTIPDVAQLIVYKPANVFFMARADGLKAPDQYTMYLVPRALCADTSTLGGPSENPRAMVLLYGRVSGNDVVPRCVSL